MYINNDMSVSRCSFLSIALALPIESNMRCFHYYYFLEIMLLSL